MGLSKILLVPWDCSVSTADEHFLVCCPCTVLTTEFCLMGCSDWVALIFSCVIVSFQIVGELKDIELCTISRQRKRDTVTLHKTRATTLKERNNQTVPKRTSKHAALYSRLCR